MVPSFGPLLVQKSNSHYSVSLRSRSREEMTTAYYVCLREYAEVEMYKKIGMSTVRESTQLHRNVRFDECRMNHSKPDEQDLLTPARETGAIRKGVCHF
jgi:hypothetical protein